MLAMPLPKMNSVHLAARVNLGNRRLFGLWVWGAVDC
jgi:hypothetical protein